MKHSFSTVASTTIRTALFSDTAISKIIGRDAFNGALRQLPMIAKGAGLLAWVIPLAGPCCVLLLFFPPAHSPPAGQRHC